MTDCPKCLGIGDIFIHSKLKVCNLCNGEKVVNNDLAEDFISSIHPFEDEITSY